MRLPLAVLPLVLLVGCKAESLGVDVPKGGPDHLSPEDLQRDTWMFGGPEFKVRTPGTTAARELARRVEGRMAEMHLMPAFGESFHRDYGEGGWAVCGQRDGQTKQAVVVVALDRGTGAGDGALSLAALISLAKAFDVAESPRNTVVLCALPADGWADHWLDQPPVPPDATAAFFILGPVDGEAISALPGPMVGSISTIRATTGALDLHGTDEDRIERIDYRTVARHLRDVYFWIADVGAGD